MYQSTIVTAFYKIPSKASFEKYLPWIRNFLIFIESPIVFFTTEDLVDIFKSIRNENIIYEILPFEELVAIKQYGKDFWERQKERDPEKYHTPELGMIWYEKKEFVLKAIEKNYYNTEYFIWCDAGCVRSDLYKNNIKNFGQNLTQINENKLNIQQIKPFLTKEFYSFPDICIAGAIMIGNKEKWNMFKKYYDIILEKYDKNKTPTIMDQYIMAGVYQNFKEDINPIYKIEKCVDEWFFFLEMLS